MQTLACADLHKVYQVQTIYGTEDMKHHLQNLGIFPDAPIVLLQKNADGGILLLKNNRLALSREVLDKIIITEMTTQQEWVPLSTLKNNEHASVVAIHGQGALKRRLMDMGLTKGVAVYISNVAPLGDPIEISLRGYKLTLRKEEVAFILVAKENNE